mgnify:FL=1|tara:strand:+ start:442 stop:660 length:219 start_codon:yes stop_codon:yes gene_type:complete
MKTCRICIYSRIFLLLIFFLVIILLLNDELLVAFKGLEPLHISLLVVGFLGLGAVSKKILEIFFLEKKIDSD